MRIDELPTIALEFLRGARLATIVRHGQPYPLAVPVWFDWDGSSIQIFSRPDRPKVERLSADPRVSVLVSAEVAEPVYWVRIDGDAEIDDNADELVSRLCDRYLESGHPAHDALRADLVANAADCVRITIHPRRFHHFVS
jgi:nitroimidazol reductase NimA-like FMN-containing flavoprotein (pyridoxamine 5'-phosphate oxidase superfamily)